MKLYKLKQLKGAYIHWVPINAWVLIHEKLYYVVDMGAYNDAYFLWVLIIPIIRYANGVSFKIVNPRRACAARVTVLGMVRSLLDALRNIS